MKKYLLMLCAFAGAVALSACGKEDGPQQDDSLVKLESATYFGEKYGSGLGVYEIVLSKGKNEMRIQLISDLPADVKKARPTSATYKKGLFAPGTADKPVNKTFIVATDTADDYGTLYFSDGVPTLVTGGTIKYASSGTGGTTITANLETDNGALQEWKFNASQLEYKIELAPVEQPKVTVTDYAFYYNGKYELATTDMDYVQLACMSEENPEYVLWLNLTVPTAADADKVTLAPGEYPVVPDTSIEVNQCVAGMVDGGYLQPSYEVLFNSAGNQVGYVLIESGKVTVTKDGDNYNISTNLAGTAYDFTGAETGKRENIVFNFVNTPLGYAIDTTRPASSLEGDLDLGEISLLHAPDRFYIDNQNQNAGLVWRFLAGDESVDLREGQDYETTGTLECWGTGNIIDLQFSTPFMDKGLPTGRFPMFDKIMTLKLASEIPQNVALTANIDIQDALAAGAGCWWAEISRDEESGRLYQSGGAGAMPSKGFIDITQDGNVYTFAFEFYDKYDHKITGSFKVTVQSGDEQ